MTSDALQEHHHHAFMRLTASVPISRAVMLESGLHLSLLLQPFQSHDASSMPHVDEIGRCRDCQAYMNVFTPFEERGYVCTFCLEENQYDQRANARYIGASRRKRLPELKGVFYDVSLDDREEGDCDDGGEGGEGDEGGEGAPNAKLLRPVFFAVVDVTGTSDVVEEFRSALLTVLDQLPEDQYFALALLDESSMYVMNWNANRFHTVRATDDKALRTIADRIALKDVLGRVGTIKKAAGLLVSQLEPKPVKQGAEHAHNCFFGEAIKALLGFLLKASRAGVPHLDVDGRLLGSRIATFVCKVPRKGSGRVLSQDERLADERRRGFYMDSINPEIAMANLSVADDDNTTEAVNPPVLRSGILDDAAQEFYSGAGAAAAVAGLSVDVYVVGQGEDIAGVENLAIVTSLSGGEFAVFDVARGDDVTLAEDLHDALQRGELLDCSIRIRTSGELQVLGNMDSRLQEDSEQCNMYHSPRLTKDETCGGILLDLRDSGRGLSNRTPAYVQAAVRFHRIDDGGVLRRCLRVITYEFPLAKTVGEVLVSHAVDVHLAVEFNGAMSLVGLSGRDEAATALDDRLEQYIAMRQAWIEEGDYVDDGDEARRREVLGTDVFGLGMRRLVQILDGGGNPGDFERLEWLYYGKRRGGAGSGLLDVIFGAE